MLSRAPSIRVDPAAWVSKLIIMALTLVFAHLIATAMVALIGGPGFTQLAQLLSLDVEYNIPTTFAVGLFLLCAFLFRIAWSSQRNQAQRPHVWLVLAITFVLLAVDELCSIHEGLALPVRSALGTSGLLYFAWVIPYTLGTLVLALYVTPTILRLPAHIRKWFVAAALVFVGGCIGFEMLEGWARGLNSYAGDLAYAGFMVFEESCEMAGLIMLVYALLLLINCQQQEITISFGHQLNRGQASRFVDAPRPGAASGEHSGDFG